MSPVAGQGHDGSVWEHMKESGARNGESIASIKKVFEDWRRTGKQFDENHAFHEDNAEFGTATGRYPYTYVPWEPEDEQYQWYPSADVILTKNGELRKIKWGEDVPQWKRFAHLGLSQTRHFPRGVRTNMALLLLHRNRTGASKPSEKELERIKNDPELLEDYARYAAEQGRALTDYDIDSNRIPVLNRSALKNHYKGLNPHPEDSNYVAPPYTQTHIPISQHDIDWQRNLILGRLGTVRGISVPSRTETPLPSTPESEPRTVTPPPAALSPEEGSKRIRHASQGGDFPAGGRPVVNEPPVNAPSKILKPDSKSTIEEKPVTKKPTSKEDGGTQLPLDMLVKFVTA
jgi:hypothetical protein